MSQSEYVRLFTMGELFCDGDGDDAGWKCSHAQCENRSNTIALTKRDVMQMAKAVPQEVMAGDDWAAISGPLSSAYILTHHLGEVVCTACVPPIDPDAQTSVLHAMISSGEITPGVQPVMPGNSVAVVECPSCHQMVGDEAPVRAGAEKNTWVITCTHCRQEWAARKGDFRERHPRPRNPFTPIKIVGH